MARCLRKPRPVNVTYILPTRAATPQTDPEFSDYLRWVSGRAELIVVDGSPDPVFGAHSAQWGKFAVHIPPDPDLVSPMGKVGGVLTGIRRATHEKLIIADDDVRYDATSLAQVADALETAEVVRPQNYFDPLPWHAYLDTGRMLLNRMMGGDWPGTLGARRSVLCATGGYDGGVMFENLELVRTVQAAGGREAVLLDAYVLRRPATITHFLDQRVRQAFDEIARPGRMATQLAVLPIIGVLAVRRRWGALAAGALAITGLAELGRRRAGGARFFPAAGSLLAPLWVAERSITSWLALGSKLLLGGVRYRGAILPRAATPARELRARHAAARRALHRSA